MVKLGEQLYRVVARVEVVVVVQVVVQVRQEENLRTMTSEAGTVSRL